MTRILVYFIALTATSFAGGGGQELEADMNGWRLTFATFNDGPCGQIEKLVDGKELKARFPFDKQIEYLLVAHSLPRTTNNKKSKFWIKLEDTPSKPIYLDPDRAKPLFELMLLIHRNNLRSENPELVEDALRKNPPIGHELLPNKSFEFKVSGENKLKK
jgi:hypothetical protein